MCDPNGLSRSDADNGTDVYDDGGPIFLNFDSGLARMLMTSSAMSSAAGSAGETATASAFGPNLTLSPGLPSNTSPGPGASSGPGGSAVGTSNCKDCLGNWGGHHDDGVWAQCPDRVALTYPPNSVLVPFELMVLLVNWHVLVKCDVRALVLIRRLLVMTVEVVPRSVAAWEGMLPVVRNLSNVPVPALGALFPSRLMATVLKFRLMAGLNLDLLISLL